MQSPAPKRPGLERLGTMKRKAVSMSSPELINTGYLRGGQPLPLVIQPAVEGVDLITWAGTHLQQIEADLRTHGGILFRNFDIRDVAQFEQFTNATTAGHLLGYTYRSTPRSQVSGNIYTSTEYPADQSIPFHNEMSYAQSWPLKIWFFSVTAAQQGGETPIADSRKIYKRLDPQIRERFARKQVMYVRNYGEGVDLPWQNVFQTESKAEVESFCRNAGIGYEWKSGDRLKTTQVCQAVARAAKTGEMVWFNQAHLFHVSSLPPDVQAMLLATFAEADLPRNTYYGDGSPIESGVLDEIRGVYAQESVSFPWQNGDILLLDNMLVAHSRAPFVGPRKVVVAMAEEYTHVEV